MRLSKKWPVGKWSGDAWNYDTYAHEVTGEYVHLAGDIPPARQKKLAKEVLRACGICGVDLENRVCGFGIIRAAVFSKDVPYNTLYKVTLDFAVDTHEGQDVWFKICADCAWRDESSRPAPSYDPDLVRAIERAKTEGRLGDRRIVDQLRAERAARLAQERARRRLVRERARDRLAQDNIR